MTTLCIADLDPRLQKRIRIDDDGHWAWTGAFTGRGYGTFKEGANGRRGQWLAHRLIYTLMVGAIADGLQIDPLGRDRACVNPHHLEPVTPGENTRRGENGNSGKPGCILVHVVTAENTRTVRAGTDTLRQCLTCERLRGAQKRASS